MRLFVLNESDRNRNSAIKLGAGMIIVSIILGVFCACKHTESIFPQLPDQSIITTETTSYEESLPPNYVPEVPTITIAGPISQDTAEYLSRLFYLKSNNLMGEGVTGSNISLSYVSSVEPDFVVEVLTTSGSGATMLSVDAWKQSETMPDIFLTESMSELMHSNDLLLLNDYVALNPLLSPSNVYFNIIDHLKYGPNIYGIPYSASLDVFFANNDIVALFQEESLPYEFNLVSLLDISNQIVRFNDERSADDSVHPILPILSTEALIPHLIDIESIVDILINDSSLEISDLDSSMFEGINYLRQYSSGDYSIDYMSPEQKDEWFGTLDPILSNRVALWTGMSEDISRWSNYFPYSMSILQIPVSNEDQISNPHLTVYPLCIFVDTEYPQLATDFATFIALDEDAVLLRLRLEVIEGYLPVLRARRIWDASFANTQYSSVFSVLREVMEDATFSNRVTDYERHIMIQEAIQVYGRLLINSDEDMYEILEMFFDDLLTG